MNSIINQQNMEQNAIYAVNGVAGSAQNCCSGFGYTLGQCYPSYYTHTPRQDMAIRKVVNGFIVSRNGCEHVFATVESMSKWISSEFKS